MRYTISRLNERKGTSFKHVLNGVRGDKIYAAGDIFIMLEFFLHHLCSILGVFLSIGLLEFHGNKLYCITC